MISKYYHLFRVKHWVKNTFIFLPLFFSAHLFDIELFKQAVVGFFCFSFSASSVYIFNDWIDINKDKLHPKKKNRPLASGQISIKRALLIAFSISAISLAVSIAYFENVFVFLILALYLIQNVLYTLKLKQIAIIDITIISLGFVLRVLLGGVITGIALSQWIILMTFLLSLFLAFAKRRDDLIILEKSGIKARKSIDGYNLQFVDISLSISATIVIIAYLMYTMSESVIERINSNIYVTSFFVIVAVLRYLKLTIVENKSGNPTSIIYKDLFIQLLIICWVISFLFFLYL